MSGRLEGQVAVITGGGGGIGEAYCRRFVDEGARVAVVDIGREQGMSVAESLGDAAAYVHCDISDEEAGQRFEGALSHPSPTLSLRIVRKDGRQRRQAPHPPEARSGARAPNPACDSRAERWQPLQSGGGRKLRGGC